MIYKLIIPILPIPATGLTWMMNFQCKYFFPFYWIFVLFSKKTHHFGHLILVWIKKNLFNTRVLFGDP